MYTLHPTYYASPLNVETTIRNAGAGLEQVEQVPGSGWPDSKLTNLYGEPSVSS